MPRDRAHQWGDTKPTWAPKRELKEPGNWGKLCGFYVQLIMMKMVVVRGKILFQTLGIWIVTSLENSAISAFLYAEKWSHDVVFCFLLVSP